MNHATKAFRGVFSEKLAPYGLTSAQWAVLAVVASMEEAGRRDETSAATIGTRLQMDRTTTSGIVRRLARGGWVRVRTNPRDRRERLISLTPKARAAMPTFNLLREETVERASRGIDEAELATLKDLLRRVIDNLT